MPPEMIFQDTIVLSAGHSILTPHLGKKMDGNSFSEKFFAAAKKDKKSLDSYGLFGSSLDYNTYYPDATPEQFNPAEDEFIEPVYRMLSNCVVAKPYSPTEFPADVLKAGMHLLVGQTVNCDHSTDIGNAIGSVVEVYWQEAYTDESGVNIPAGINGKLKIDAKANPRIARGINMDPPSIHSNSVTIMFEWKPSHEFENKWEFWEKLGTYDKDGQLIRRIATRIIAFKETSLVSHGADPYAQLIKDGKLVNPVYADNIYNSFSEEKVKEVRKKIDHSRASFIDYKGFSEKVTNHNTSENIIEGVNSQELEAAQLNNLNNQNSMPELLQFIEQLFGEGMLSLAEGATATTEHALAEIRRVVSENASLAEAKTSLETEVTGLKEKVTGLEADLKANQRFAEIGTTYFQELKESTMASYKKTCEEGKEDANIISLIESVDSVNTMLSLKKTYDAQLEERFPLHCADCGSHNVNRASSVESGQANLEDKTDASSVTNTLSNIAASKL